MNKIFKYTTILAAIMTLSACAGGMVNMGGGSNVATGSAGGSTVAGANSELQRCDSPLGTLAVEENMDSPWYVDYRRNSGYNSIAPMLKLIVQQSNCFMVISDSVASNSIRDRQRELSQSGELRSNSNMGAGQRKAADYVLETSVMYSDTAGGMGATLGAVGGLFGAPSLGHIGTLAETKQTSVNLNLTDIRSMQQVGASEGSSSSTNLGAALGGLSGSIGGSLGGYTRTPEGKALSAAFMDAYNKLVVSVKNYNPQVDASGRSGTGGSLTVQ